jgi:hypothetical protein
MKRLTKKQQRSAKRRYHLRWKEEQKLLREEAKERKGIKKELHELRMRLQTEGKHDEIKELPTPEEERKRRMFERMEWEAGFNPDGSFDPNRSYRLSLE